jgi:glyoxylate/hydroxypyruvate reductase
MAIGLFVGRDDQDRQNYTYFLNNIPQQLTTLEPGLDIRIYPAIDDYNEIDFAIAWRPPFGIFTQFPNLRCIASLGAGVDHLVADQDLPTHIPIVRIVDPNMSVEITQYVVATVLYWMKRFDVWAANQAQKVWGRSLSFNFGHKTVGILGLGFLGKHAAEALQSLGVKVIGWSNSPKQLPNIQTFTGASELSLFLSKSDALVCLLPLTPETHGILNAKNFAQLPPDAYLINLGRGGHLIEADLLAALSSGQLSGACLDVFPEEPLPASHPFWGHPQIRVTPHIASVTNPMTVSAQILDNYHRAIAGMPLLNQVDTQKGY